MRTILSTIQKLNIVYLLSKCNSKEFYHLKNKKKVIVFLAANYGNLGDVAITYAQETFLSQEYPDYEIVELPIDQTLKKLKSIAPVCTSNDIITIVGGGNMGDLYPDIEFLRQLVIKKFPNNQIISFPQTIDFSKTKTGNSFLKKTKQLYNRHEHLTLLARENISYKKMKEFFPSANVFLTPDIVMTLDVRQEKKRNGVIFCLRSDLEGQIKQEEKELLYKIFQSKYHNISHYDTHIGRGNLSKRERMEELKKIWGEFSSAEWVITDRLHGMIFCFITRTPAIVLPNNNFKIKECYKWIQTCGYIFFIEELSEESIYEVLSKRKIDNFQKNSEEINQTFKKIFNTFK